MQVLEKWVSEKPNRHFIFKYSGTCINTRCRIMVWERKEGHGIEVVPGHGFGETANEAARMAIEEFNNQDRPLGSTNCKVDLKWYMPMNIELKLRGYHDSLCPCSHCKELKNATH